MRNANILKGREREGEREGERERERERESGRNEISAVEKFLHPRFSCETNELHHWPRPQFGLMIRLVITQRSSCQLNITRPWPSVSLRMNSSDITRLAP